MKRCPKCDFGFVNFHQVCDFDGTELVDDPHTLPISPAVSALVAATRSPLPRLLKSPVFFTGVALAGVLASLLLLVYFDAARQPHSISKSAAVQDSVVSIDPSLQLPAPIKLRPSSTSRSAISEPQAAKVRSLRREREAVAFRSRARSRPTPSIRNQQRRTELALQRQPRGKSLQKEPNERAFPKSSNENADRKESKLTATLKTTWRILKKPFKF